MVCSSQCFTEETEEWRQKIKHQAPDTRDYDESCSHCSSVTPVLVWICTRWSFTASGPEPDLISDLEGGGRQVGDGDVLQVVLQSVDERGNSQFQGVFVLKHDGVEQ